MSIGRDPSAKDFTFVMPQLEGQQNAFITNGLGASATKPRGDEEVRWYVLAVNNMRFEDVREQLKSEYGADNVFYLSCTDLVTVNGVKKKIADVPVIRTLIFVRASVVMLNETNMRFKVTRKTESAPFRFYLSHLNHIPNDRMYIGDKQMEHFINTYRSQDHVPMIMLAKELPPLEKGQKVRIVNGSLQNVIGTYIQLRRGQRKKFTATLQNFITVSIDLHDDELMEIVNDKME